MGKGDTLSNPVLRSPLPKIQNMSGAQFVSHVTHCLNPTTPNQTDLHPIQRTVPLPCIWKSRQCQIAIKILRVCSCFNANRKQIVQRQSAHHTVNIPSLKLLEFFLCFLGSLQGPSKVVKVNWS